MKKQLLVLITIFTLSFSLQAQDSPELKMGGAVRFNYSLSSWKKGQLKRLGDFGYDVFLINAQAKYKGISLVADLRCYETSIGGTFLKKGWLAYDFTPQDQIQLGLTQVPFGIGPANSHSFFFSSNYYVGLEDDYDMGLKFQHRGTNFEYDIAYFKNSDETRFGNNSDISFSRYGYDVASMDVNGDGKLDFRNKEQHQLDGRFIGVFRTGEAVHKIGASTEFGGLYDLNTSEYGYHYAVAGHYELNYKGFNAMLQASHYQHNPANKLKGYENVIAMGAYGSPYLVASKAMIYSLGLAYTFNINGKILDKIQIYNDFSMMDKSPASFNATFLNVLGATVTAGNIFMFIDCAMGKNQPYLGGNFNDCLAQGDPNAEWKARLNINLGYYF